MLCPPFVAAVPHLSVLLAFEQLCTSYAAPESSSLLF